MDRITSKLTNLARRKNRVRATVYGSTDRPRLSVFVSNKHIAAQIIDDSKHKTLVYSSTVGMKIDGNMTEKAAAIGKEVANKAKKAKINKIVFDRNGKLYHGRIKALADAARSEGLEF